MCKPTCNYSGTRLMPPAAASKGEVSGGTPGRRTASPCTPCWAVTLTHIYRQCGTILDLTE